MLTCIDHVAIAVANLDDAMRDYTELGFTVVVGGTHPGGSRNVLVAFSDGCYLELITFPGSASDHRWAAAQRAGLALVDFCAGTDDLDATVMSLRRAGATITDPEVGGRTRPDGVVLQWRTATTPSTLAGVMPFLIRDDTPRDERVPKERSHRNGAAGVGALTVVVHDPAAVARRFAGAASQPSQPVVREDVDGRGVRLTLGPHTVDYLAPARDGGVLQEWLDAHGPSPYQLTLRGRSGSASGPLDLRRSHGARIVLTGS
jgi:catechol 2,3-dioxygenase-like lactoylglutathione lyase family enzyme